jgi:hypothetical protein
MSLRSCLAAILRGSLHVAIRERWHHQPLRHLRQLKARSAHELGDLGGVVAFFVPFLLLLHLSKQL